MKARQRNKIVRRWYSSRGRLKWKKSTIHAAIGPFNVATHDGAFRVPKCFKKLIESLL